MADGRIRMLGDGYNPTLSVGAVLGDCINCLRPAFTESMLGGAGDHAQVVRLCRLCTEDYIARLTRAMDMYKKLTDPNITFQPWDEPYIPFSAAGSPE